MQSLDSTLVVPLGIIMIDQTAKSFLVSIGAPKLKHGSTNLLTHSLGVGDILIQLGVQRHVQIAGFLHAVYGADCYEDLKKMASRSMVLHKFGTQVEELVYLYSCVDSRTLYLSLTLRRFELLSNRYTGLPLTQDKEKRDEVYWLLFANITEQEYRKLRDLEKDIYSKETNYSLWSHLASYLGEEPTALWKRILSGHQESSDMGKTAL